MPRQVVLHVGQHFVAALGADPDRRLRLLGCLAQIGRYRLVACHHDRGGLVVHDLLHRIPALAGIECIEVFQFVDADDLDLVRIDDVEIADQRWPPLQVLARLDQSMFAALTG